MTLVKAAVSPEQFTSFGDLLRYLRRREELTQLELAIQVGYSDTQISRIEQNQRVPDAATLKALFVPALHLDQEVDWVGRLLELAPLSDPELLAQTVASVLGIVTQSSTISHLQLLINFLCAKNALLILDNCEHLLDACAEFSDTLLKNCSQLNILATSRQPLGVLGEMQYRLPSLGLPDSQLTIENIRGSDSVRLFEERAQLTQPDFILARENATFVTQICSLLDGLPLAIELAAARVNIFSTAQIAARLGDCFDLLTGGARTALPHPPTIRASKGWSLNRIW